MEIFSPFYEHYALFEVSTFINRDKVWEPGKNETKMFKKNEKKEKIKKKNQKKK